MSAKICLVVIFNHRYDRNLPFLRERYQGVFSHVRFLVPFYRGADADVIPVAASSATFQGYIAQGWRSFAGEKFTHYVFVADDMVLNPGLNEDNLLVSLSLGKDDAYIQELRPLTKLTFHWPFLHRTLQALQPTSFVNAAPELPSREEAIERLAAHGVRITSFGWRTLRFGQGSWWWKLRALLAGTLFLYGTKGVRQVTYPLAMSYSDFFVVPAAAMAEFAHLCGVFTAMGVFVECAIPTALAFASRSIHLEGSSQGRGKEIFDLDELAAFEEQYHHHLPTLLADFPADTLYIHPVKLSRWQLEGERSPHQH